MDAHTSKSAYQDRTRWFKVSGVLLLLSGIAVGLLGPLEMYCLIAALLIPLGYGHLKMRRWVRPLALALLWAWLVVGAPLSAVASFILAASKDLSLPAVLAVLVFLGLSYLVAPGLLIRFYRGRNIRHTLATKDPRSYWIEGLPTPILVLSCLRKPGVHHMGHIAATALGVVGVRDPVGLVHVLNHTHFLPIELCSHPGGVGISATGAGIPGWRAGAGLSFRDPGRNTAPHHLGRGASIETMLPANMR